MNKKISFIFGILILLVSAVISASVSINPNSLTLTGYPRQTFKQNITINTDNPTWVFLGASNKFINITPNAVFVDGNLVVPLNITFASDIQNGTHAFTIDAVEIIENQPSISVGGGGSKKIIVQNRTIEVPVYVDKFIEVEKNKTDDEMPEQEIEKEISKKGIRVWLKWAIPTLIFLFLILFIKFYKDERRYKKQENE